MNIDDLKMTLRQFAEERDWARYHTPKNLSMAIAGESGELLELFQWLTPEESHLENLPQETKTLVKDELADILIYVFRLADQLEIDIEDAIKAKIAKNAEKYPIELAKGNATKYSRRDS